MLMARGLEGKQSKHLTVNESIGSEQGDPEGVCFSLVYRLGFCGRVSKLGVAFVVLAMKWEMPVAYTP